MPTDRKHKMPMIDDCDNLPKRYFLRSHSKLHSNNQHKNPTNPIVVNMEVMDRGNKDKVEENKDKMNSVPIPLAVNVTVVNGGLQIKTSDNFMIGKDSKQLNKKIIDCLPSNGQQKKNPRVRKQSVRKNEKKEVGKKTKFSPKVGKDGASKKFCIKFFDHSKIMRRFYKKLELIKAMEAAEKLKELAESKSRRRPRRNANPAKSRASQNNRNTVKKGKSKTIDAEVAEQPSCSTSNTTKINDVIKLLKDSPPQQPLPDGPSTSKEAKMIIKYSNNKNVESDVKMECASSSSYDCIEEEKSLPNLLIKGANLHDDNAIDQGLFGEYYEYTDGDNGYCYKSKLPKNGEMMKATTEQIDIIEDPNVSYTIHFKYYKWK